MKTIDRRIIGIAMLACFVRAGFLLAEWAGWLAAAIALFLYGVAMKEAEKKP